jgi:hypothetical protein
METQQVIELIRRELPAALQNNRELSQWVFELTRPYYAEKAKTESRFDQMLEQLKIDREESNRRWEEHNRKADEERAEQRRLWEEHNRKADEERAEQRRLWEENHQEIRAILAEMKAQDKRHNATLGALGARWGLSSENSFRMGLRAILEESFGVKVENITEYDTEGRVFGRPDQVELDIIIYNGMVILCELKSSISRSDMLTFHRKTIFYQEKHQRPVTRKIVISPMVEPKAIEIADTCGIEVYSHSVDVPAPLP